MRGGHSNPSSSAILVFYFQKHTGQIFICAQIVPVSVDAGLLHGFVFGGNIHALHQIVDARLPRDRPLAVVFAHDLRAVAENIGDFLKAGAAAQQLGRKGVTKAMRVSAADARRLEHRAQAPIHMRLVRLFLPDNPHDA